ncbi:MAG TPA: hypothetical protein PK857_10855 [Hyphomicrobium sp.]|nr:hypothetical protein [Hyphomicrobium sp.]HRO49828.1 hypothetical protein [Hyphomicrobium sp.]
MKSLIVIAIGGIAGLIIGWVVTAAAVILFGERFGLSNFEGQRDVMAAFGYGPAGGLVGLVIGVWIGRRLGRS